MPACLRTMAPRRALEGPKRAVRVRVLRRCCAPAFRAATVPVLAPWLALEGLASGAASGASMAGAGAVGGGCRMRTRSGQAGYRVHGRGGRWYTPRCPGASTRGLHGQEFERGAHVRARTLTGGGVQVGAGRCGCLRDREGCVGVRCYSATQVQRRGTACGQTLVWCTAAQGQGEHSAPVRKFGASAAGNAGCGHRRTYARACVPI